VNERTASVSIVIATLLCTIASGAQGQEVGNALEGLKFAQDACAECHLVVKAEGRSNNPDAPTFAAIARTPGLTRAALAAALQTSHRSMPNFIIKPDDAANVMAYILSLKE
jgi:mono/diheme cytochrome c family protein